MHKFSYLKYIEVPIMQQDVCTDIPMRNRQDSIYDKGNYTRSFSNMKYRCPVLGRNICTHILTWEIEKNHLSGFHLHNAVHVKQVLWNKPEEQHRKGYGSGSRMGGTTIYFWLINVDAWQKPLQYCIGINSQLN